MDWLLEDWEYPNDEIFAAERQYLMQLEWQQWEEEQASKNRLPAVIKVVKPILIDEAERNTRTVRGAHQTRL